ncbi:thiamine biosynthesis protein ThiS [Deferribacter desulfuricans SSM1]|uniref:Thiamine biosynthesis protein ThiS n=1 Tax=Deferribacter desulfuricans (strain DSM 14783 / JCM 11476 / NBRC 101012 / SSM1) TaxID=639282 RepID=D3P9Q9_DEFDS|nr:sulfur carrier protein ThiS [Deferribacter desulfuricans]BAI81449.1 thiamine biosynthesis protein ThiS [Deferribacter desulfuricans SSM1]
MEIKINGKTKIVEDNQTVADIINNLKLNVDRIVIEYNGEVLDKKNYDSIVLKDGDVLELIQFVGGG